MRTLRLLTWSLGQMFQVIPNAMLTSRFESRVSRTSIWLATENPLANHPWARDPQARLPAEVEVLVIGAGFTGSACAYHWSKQGGGAMAVLEMDETASGSSGRNEGMVVMGRYFAYVKETMLKGLCQVRPDLNGQQRDTLATRFATAYVRSAYKNAELIEETISREGFDCDYVRTGWIQARDAEDQHDLEESVRLGDNAGFDDWTSIDAGEVHRLGGMTVDQPAGYSKRAASWDPAKWVWSLLTSALKTEQVALFTHTKVLAVEDQGESYLVRTNRGALRARFIINATESYSALLHSELRGVLHPVQTQIAFGEGGPEGMRPLMGMQSTRGFFGRLLNGVIFGSDSTRLPYRRAGSNNPSRFISKFLIGEMGRYFGPSRLLVTREWSCTSGFTDDEYPVVGLLDGKLQYIIGGMCGSGSAVHFNAARHVVQQILGLDGPDDYPAEFFAPTRVLDPQNHAWPAISE